MKLWAIVVSLSVSLIALSAPAFGEIIGQADLNGRTIVVDGNGTWVYKDGEPLSSINCENGKSIKSSKLDLSVCMQEPWRLSASPSSSFEFQLDDIKHDLYGGIITERIAMPAEVLEEAILYNAALGSNVRVEDIVVTQRSKANLNNKEWNYIEYDVNFKGVYFRFANYYISLGEAGSAQFVFWCSKPYFDSNKKYIESVVATLIVSDKILQ